MCSLERDILNGNCSPDERDLGLVESEGGVVLEALFNCLDKQLSVSLLSRRPSTACAFFQ